MATWGSGYEAKPTNSDSPTLGDNEIRATRSDTRARMENEHLTYNDTTAGAESEDFRHKEGSARAFWESAEPTNAPSGGTLAQGHLWIDSDDNQQLYVHNGTDFLKVTGILTTGPQTVTGVKTFSAAPVFSGGVQIGDAGTALKTKVITLIDQGTGWAKAAHGLITANIRGLSVTATNATSYNYGIQKFGIYNDEVWIQYNAAYPCTNLYATIFYIGS